MYRTSGRRYEKEGLAKAEEAESAKLKLVYISSTNIMKSIGLRLMMPFFVIAMLDPSL